MPNQTTNYNLTKPLETERYDVQVFNNNADIIDAQMKSNADGIANVNSRLDNLNNWTTVEFTLADFMYDIELETMGIDSTKPLSRIEDLLIQWKESFNE